MLLNDASLCRFTFHYRLIIILKYFKWYVIPQILLILIEFVKCKKIVHLN